MKHTSREFSEETEYDPVRQEFIESGVSEEDIIFQYSNDNHGWQSGFLGSYFTSDMNEHKTFIRRVARNQFNPVFRFMATDTTRQG